MVEDDSDDDAWGADWPGEAQQAVKEEVMSPVMSVGAVKEEEMSEDAWGEDAEGRAWARMGEEARMKQPHTPPRVAEARACKNELKSEPARGSEDSLGVQELFYVNRPEGEEVVKSEPALGSEEKQQKKWFSVKREGVSATRFSDWSGGTNPSANGFPDPSLHFKGPGPRVRGTVWVCRSFPT